MNINTNLLCQHRGLSLSVAGLSGSLLNHMSSCMVVHEQPQFRERLICCSGTFVNSS